MSNEQVQTVTAAQVVIALANMASKGKYDNVTPAEAREMNAIFDAAAELINQLEAAENQLEQAKQDAAAIAMDEEIDNDSA